MTDKESRPRRRWLIVGLVVSLSLVTMSAWAFGGRHGHGEGRDFQAFMLNRMLDRVDASDEQRAQITAIVESAHEEMRAQREGRREEIHDRAVAVLTAESVDAQALEALRIDLREQMDQGTVRISQALVEVANVLDQDQRIALAEAIEERFEERGGRHGRPF